jgi:hypothetical protein
MPSQTSKFAQQQLDTATEEYRFLCGLCQDVTSRTAREVEGHKVILSLTLNEVK